MQKQQINEKRKHRKQEQIMTNELKIVKLRHVLNVRAPLGKYNKKIKTLKKNQQIQMLM